MAILISEPPGNLFRTRTLRVGQSYRLTFDKADTLLETGTWTVTQRSTRRRGRKERWLFYIKFSVSISKAS